MRKLVEALGVNLANMETLPKKAIILVSYKNMV